MAGKHFFSVIIPTYNRRDFLKIAIESVLAQAFSDFELIIVDDGSTDTTPQLVKSFNDKRIRYLQQDNRGPSAARNSGIRNAKAEYICFLDSDDRYRNEKLEITYDFIRKNPDYKIFHTEELWYRDAKYLPQKKEHKKPEGSVFNQALKICCISLSTACIHREVFKEAGYFDEDFPVCEDYEFWLRATLIYPVKLIPFHLTIKEGGHTGQRSRQKGLDKYRFQALYKIMKNYTLPSHYTKEALYNLEEKAGIYIKGAEKRKKTEEVKDIRMKLTEIKEIHGN